MLDRKNFKALTCGLLLLSTLAPAAVSGSRDARFPISAQSVANALTAAGVPVNSAQVRFLSPVSATGHDSSLQVVEIARWAGDTAKVQLRCRDRRACLPFYVLLTGAGKTDTRGQTLQPTSGISSGGQGAIEAFAKQTLIRDGDPATLVFDDSRLRISLPVICLQSGSRGQTIRVESRDHKRFFKARIVESGLLKATL